MEVGYWLDAVRAQRPLVHNITNLVVTNIAANALLSMGASPVMAYAHEEVADMAGIAQAVSLNMGTLTPEIVTAMRIAGAAAGAANVPVVFDPVGVGATPYRNQVASSIVHDIPVKVLRGNAGELSVFLGLGGKVNGVDSVMANDDLPVVMKDYAKQHQMVVIATGEVDTITDGECIWRLSNGHPLLAAITGSGCMLTAILGAFIGVVPKGSELRTYAHACIAAVTCYNVAAQLAAETSAGPGTFQTNLFDALYHLNKDVVQRLAQVVEA